MEKTYTHWKGGATTEGFRVVYLTASAISVRPGQSIRPAKNATRPKQIAIIFDRVNMEGIYKTKESKEKFDMWLKNAVYCALDWEE